LRQPSPKRDEIASAEQGIVSRPKTGQYESILPTEVTDFAARYPLVTVAGLGAIGTAVLIGSSSLAARLFRRGAAVRSSRDVDARLSSLEARVVGRLQETLEKDRREFYRAINALTTQLPSISIGEHERAVDEVLRSVLREIAVAAKDAETRLQVCPLCTA
jgi:hypothetical protein